MDINLNGKNALVTGGANGLGRDISLKLSQSGARVAFTSRDSKALSELSAELGQSHLALNYDISCSQDLEIAYKKIISEFGHIDILINNVGHTLEIKDPYVVTKKQLNSVMNLNFFSHVEMINKVLPGMKERNWGRIVNITSLAGLEISGPAPFNAAKAALTAYTKSVGRLLALERRNIVMTAVAPGIVVTKGGHWEKMLKEAPDHAEKYLKERAALGRFGTEDEVNGIVVFLASDHASFFHGSIIQVDGGQSRHYMYNNFLDS